MSWTERLARVFLGSVFSPSSRGRKSSPPRGRRIVVEALEDRRLLSVGGAVELAGAAGEYDFGDLPDNYGTTLAVDGARHESTGPRLGAMRDAEADGLATVGADGDDTDGTADEDGVTFGSIMVGQLDAAVTVNVQNAPSGAKLDAWIDFNGDGSFGGAGERIADALPVAEGDNVVQFDVPAWAASGETYVRFRLSSAGNLGPIGMAADGEVEDYYITIATAAPGNSAGAPRPVFATTDSPWCVVAADMNDDGHMDILSAAYEGDEISWYENDRNENFTEHTISSSADGAMSVVVADVDDDGDLDVLAALWSGNAIVWYENDGYANFAEHTISATVSLPRSVFAEDVNGDGAMDVLSASEGDDKIAWYENDGNENFTEHTVSNSADAAYCVLASDFNGDGHVDILSGSVGDNKIAWYENDGNENFAERVISISEWTHSVFAADIDGDGDADVVSSFKGDKAVWYANDGTGSFSERMIASSADDATSVFVADVNSDGHADIVAASYGSGRVTLYKNNGNEGFTEHTISTTALDARNVVAADVDGDGYEDVISASGTGFVHLPSTIAWYENDGSGHFGNHPLTVHPGSSAETADLDGDGNLDVIAQANTMIVWRKNDGKGGFTTHLIDELGPQHYRPGDVFAVDVNGDGHTDVLSSSYDFLENTTLTWYENNGDGQFLAHKISHIESYWSGFKSVFGTDVNGDGHLDIVSMSWNQNSGEHNQIVWYENDGSEHFTEHSFAISLERPQYVVPADMDGDGHIDLLCSASPYDWGDDNLAWYKNDGHGVFTEQIIDAPPNVHWDALSIVVSDINEDGHMDFLLGGRHLLWFENDGHSAFTQHEISGFGYRLNPTMASDVNGDSHLDVLSVAIKRNGLEAKIVWHENDGTGQFIEHVLAEPAYGTEVAAGDIDGDGNLDILTASTWYNMWAIDFGDAPDNYGTTMAANGARHEATGPMLGTTRDAEVDGVASVGAEADDARPSDDEDGVTFGAIMVGQLDATVTVSLQNAPSGAKLDAWIDFDGDGSFDPRDQIADSLDVVEGDNVILFDVPESAMVGDTYVRFRLSSAGNLEPTGAADDGEVEDYRATIVAPIDLGPVDFLKLPGLDLSSGAKAYSFTTKRAAYLTVEANLSQAGGTATLRLHDATDNITLTQSNSHENRVTIGTYDLIGGHEYTLLLTGSSSNVDLKICNLVSLADKAVTVYGTDGADRFECFGFEVTINGISYQVPQGAIESIHFDGGGGEDRAVLYGTIGGTAMFSPGRGSMIDNITGFVLSVQNVAYIEAIGTASYDTVELVDSVGDDSLVATPTQMTMSGTPTDGTSYSLTANNFRYAHGYARNGGNDTAELLGSDGLERVKPYPDMVKLTGSGFFQRAKFFETTTVDTLGGTDNGAMAGSEGADVVWAMKNDVRVAYGVELAQDASPDYANLDYGVTITGCEYFVARAEGNNDWIELHDSANKDVLIAKPHKVEMMNAPDPNSNVERGAEYTITARGFRHVSAIADQGGDGDAAKLYDSAEEGVDIWTADYVDGETWSSMSSPSRLLCEVLAFEQVGGYGFNGGLGEDHGTNQKQHAEDVDFAFQYGYWEE